MFRTKYLTLFLVIPLFSFTQESDLIKKNILERGIKIHEYTYVCKEYEIIYDIKDSSTQKRIERNLALFFSKELVDSLKNELLRYQITKNDIIRLQDQEIKLVSHKKARRKQQRQNKKYDKVFCFSKPIYFKNYAIIQCFDREKWSIGCGILSLFRYEDGKWLNISELYSFCT